MACLPARAIAALLTVLLLLLAPRDAGAQTKTVTKTVAKITVFRTVKSTLTTKTTVSRTVTKTLKTGTTTVSFARTVPTTLTSVVTLTSVSVSVSTAFVPQTTTVFGTSTVVSRSTVTATETVTLQLPGSTTTLNVPTTTTQTSTVTAPTTRTLTSTSVASTTVTVPGPTLTSTVTATVTSTNLASTTITVPGPTLTTTLTATAQCTSGGPGGTTDVPQRSTTAQASTTNPAPSSTTARSTTITLVQVPTTTTLPPPGPACTPACNASQICVYDTCIMRGTLSFDLTWQADADIDLQVKPPGDCEAINYSNRQSCGGSLERDYSTAPGPENIYWPGSHPGGNYAVCVLPYEQGTQVAYTARALVDGVPFQTVSGTTDPTINYDTFVCILGDPKVAMAVEVLPFAITTTTSRTTSSRTATTTFTATTTTSRTTTTIPPGRRTVTPELDPRNTIVDPACTYVPVPYVLDDEFQTEASVFNIELLRCSSITTYDAVFVKAAQTWMSVIKSDLTENTYGSEGNGCVFVGNAARLNCRAVDDLIIGFAVEPIDGKFGILGSAGPSFIRPAGSTHEYLPVTGSMRFDSADLDSMATDGILEAVILHEMGHVLGIGTLWELKGYLDPPNCRNIVDGGADPTGARFTGPAANASLAVVDPSDSLRLGYVPVEDQFRRPGTTCGHWREATFKQELMTGFVSSNGNPLSYITAYSLVDLGYEIDPASEIINKTWNAATAQPDGGEGEKLIPLVGCFEGVPPPTIPEKTQRSKNPGRELRSSNGR